MLKNLSEKTAHYITVTVLTVFLVMAVTIAIAQNFTLFMLYDKYQKVSSAYTELTTHISGLRNLPLHEAEPDFLYSPIIPQHNSSSPAAKNKNPMNIKKLDNDVWEGQIGVDRHGHVIFSSWEYGVRAAAFTLSAYEQKHNVDTLEKLVSRFAEAKGKSHADYVTFLSNSLDIKRDQKISLIEYIPRLLRAMSKYESGLELPDELFAGYDIVGRIK